MAIQAKQTPQQQLLLAPNVTLALEVLRMPAMELQVFLRQQAEENPVLELEEADDDELDPPPVEGQAEDQHLPTNGLDEEWLSHWQQNAGVDESEEDERHAWWLEQRTAKPQSLHEVLQLQLGCQVLPEADRWRGECLIQHLDESGYLDSPLEALASESGATVDQLEAVLKLIQTFDPPGVGARDLRECLMLQLEDQGGRSSLPAAPSSVLPVAAPAYPATDVAAGRQAGLAYRILQDHFPLFLHRRIDALAHVTGTAAREVDAACETLKRLNPKPGRAYSGDLSPAIVPDLIIHRNEQHYDVALNDEELPTVGINRMYRRMLKDPNIPPEAKEFLAKKLRQATWIVKAIDERNATLLAIGRCLISVQRDFVEQGPRALKPLTQAQVAQLIGRHPSTVSRAIAGKTIDAPCGIFRLEQLFASHVPQTDASQDVSDAAIKSAIQQFIAEEDGQHPFSDEALTHRLKERQISVARRTVAKYRTTLKILPAHLRRRR